MSNVKRKTIKTLSVALVTLFIVIAISASAVIAAYGASDAHGIRQELWTSGGSSATMSTTEALSLNALLVYAKDGVFGEDCKTVAETEHFEDIEAFTSASACTRAGNFYTDAKRYAETVEDRMERFDKDGKRLDAAMENITSITRTVFSILTGFGFLVSILVFIVLFIRLSWLPSHQIQKRAFYVDVLTAGSATILLGNSWIVISLFQSTFSRFWQSFAVYSKDWRTVANLVLSEFQTFITGLSGLAVLIVVVMFIVNFALLALDGSNIQKRSDRVSALVMCGVAAVGLSCVTLICGFFWNVLG